MTTKAKRKGGVLELVKTIVYALLIAAVIRTLDCRPRRWSSTLAVAAKRPAARMALGTLTPLSSTFRTAAGWVTALMNG